MCSWKGFWSCFFIFFCFDGDIEVGVFGDLLGLFIGERWEEFCVYMLVIYLFFEYLKFRM